MIVGSYRDSWSVINGLKCLWNGRAESTSRVLMCLASHAASRRPVLDWDDFGPGWRCWEEHAGPGPLWRHVVQLGGGFWMEMSHRPRPCHVRPRHFTISAHGIRSVMHTYMATLDVLQSHVSVVLLRWLSALGLQPHLLQTLLVRELLFSSSGLEGTQLIKWLV